MGMSGTVFFVVPEVPHFILPISSIQFPYETKTTPCFLVLYCIFRKKDYQPVALAGFCTASTVKTTIYGLLQTVGSTEFGE
jgi:hypothetical protein